MIEKQGQVVIQQEKKKGDEDRQTDKSDRKTRTKLP